MKISLRLDIINVVVLLVAVTTYLFTPVDGVPKERALKSIHTEDKYSYIPATDFYQRSGRGEVLFAVQATNDAYIALGEDLNHEGKHYEIVLGGWDNTQSVIRKGNQQEHVVTKATPLLLHGDAKTFFRITWNKETLKVFKLGLTSSSDGEELMKLNTLDHKMEIKHMLVSTGWGADGNWVIYGLSRFIHTPDRKDYKYAMKFNEAYAGGEAIFSVRAKNYAHIALGDCDNSEEDCNYSGEYYEIVLGTPRSVIRSGSKKEYLVAKNNILYSKDTPQLLHGEEKFYISWNKYTLKVNRLSTKGWEKLMEVKNDRYQINQMYVSTGWGADGDWIIYEDPHKL